MVIHVSRELYKRVKGEEPAFLSYSMGHFYIPSDLSFEEETSLAQEMGGDVFAFVSDTFEGDEVKEFSERGVYKIEE